MNTSRVVPAFALLAAIVGMCLWPATGGAYEQWSDGCNDCHGAFDGGSYVSEVDQQPWGTDLMDGHNQYFGADCEVCHSSPAGGGLVYLDRGSGSETLDQISCLGCHGRAETDAGGAVTAAGLRQHHWNAGETICEDCHDDADPSFLPFATVGEDVLPPYYADPDAPASMPDDPCNPSPDYNEDIFMTAGTGLDNDGDGLYDTADVIDCPEPGSVLLRCAALASFAVLARRRRRMT